MSTNPPYRSDTLLPDQAVLVTVSAPASCHIPDKSPGGWTFCDPLNFLYSKESRSMPLKVRT